MEAAAKTVQMLSKQILPERPHCLSYSPDWRYHVPSNDSSSRHKHPEEWDIPRLQYMTFLSEADRGVLLTRSYYDMRVEPVKPVPRDVNAIAKSSGEKKKLSLSDYKNKKTGTASETTPEPTSARKKDLARAVSESLPPPSEIRKSDMSKNKDSPHKSDTKPHKVRDNNVVDMSLPPKPPSKLPPHPRPASPDRRKRGPDAEDDLRPPQKRAKPDPRLELGRANEERSRTPRDEPIRRRDRDVSGTQDRDSRGEVRKPSSSALPNGRSSLKAATGANRIPSPAGRARGDSLNGVRPSTIASSRDTPKNDSASSSKSEVPPLLSPLHLSFDTQDAAESRERKKAREDAVDGTRPSKPPKKLEPPQNSKRDKSPTRLPPLLSPTLPPLLEAELSRRTKTPPEATDKRPTEDRNKEVAIKEERRKDDRGKDDRTIMARKALPDQDEESSGKEKRKRFMVKMRIPKSLRQTVKRILALNTTREREAQRQERAESSEAAAKKRPPTDNMGDSISVSVKRPRTSELPNSARPSILPSTPSKKGTAAMSRVSSSNSQVNTPGEVTAATPSAPGSSDRTINGTVDMKGAMDKQTALLALGRKLKHAGDALLKSGSGMAQGTSNGTSGRFSETSFKRGCVMLIESVMTFMTGFHLVNASRFRSSKVVDPKGFQSTFLLLEYIQSEIRRSPLRCPSLYALALILHTVSIDQVQKSWGTYSNPAAYTNLQELMKLERTRLTHLSLVHDLVGSIESPALTPRVTAWSTCDEVLFEGMRILRRFCNEQNIDWNPELNLKDYFPEPEKSSKHH